MENSEEDWKEQAKPQHAEKQGRREGESTACGKTRGGRPEGAAGTAACGKKKTSGHQRSRSKRKRRTEETEAAKAQQHGTAGAAATPLTETNSRTAEGKLV